MPKFRQVIQVAYSHGGPRTASMVRAVTHDRDELETAVRETHAKHPGHEIRLFQNGHLILNLDHDLLKGVRKPSRRPPKPFPGDGALHSLSR